MKLGKVAADAKLRGIASDLTYKYFGNSLKIGGYFVYRKRPIKIVDGQFMGEFNRLSNYWWWKEVLPSGELKKRGNSGYGGDDSIFKPISKAKAIELAVKNEKKIDRAVIYVKTTYGRKSMRLPNISKYPNEKEAKLDIEVTVKWGIDINSCKIIGAKEAERLIAVGKAETNE